MKDIRRNDRRYNQNLFGLQWPVVSGKVIEENLYQILD